MVVRLPFESDATLLLLQLQQNSRSGTGMDGQGRCDLSHTLKEPQHYDPKTSPGSNKEGKDVERDHGREGEPQRSQLCVCPVQAFARNQPMALEREREMIKHGDDTSHHIITRLPLH
ncbi:unnamed protein product [Acanthocheilonema viteae]|uniref:Uncharacterized protein n=1 Tax=Acanthocheilonema viteae TaxID=6277 RepID=A0A498S7T1_ACAVI|nr:unnamed protein product [Acanthocheilonema viteae]